MAWAAIDLERHFALTAETRLTYLTPIPIDTEVTTTGRVIGRLGRQIWLAADVRVKGEVYVRAESRATVVGEQLATDSGSRSTPYRHRRPARAPRGRAAAMKPPTTLRWRLISVARLPVLARLSK